MKRVDELPYDVHKRQKQGYYRYALAVPVTMLDQETLMEIAVDMHMAFPQNLVYQVANGDYVGRIVMDLRDPMVRTGMIEFEVRRRMTNELSEE